MKTSANGIDLIKKFEGFRDKPYRCRAGRWTIGYGHTQDVSENSLPISQAQALEFLAHDLDDAEAAVNRYISILLSQNEFDALVSFTFNEGAGRLVTSSLRTKLNNGDRKGAAKEFARWIYVRDPKTREMVISQDLIGRRKEESELFAAVV